MERGKMDQSNAATDDEMTVEQWLALRKEARLRIVNAGTDDEMTVEQWLALRKEAGLTIDPETAEVIWTYAQVLDPYGVYPKLPRECDQVGRQYFARSPGTQIWVCFDDLPDATRKALWQKHRQNLGFPAGLEELLDEATRRLLPEPLREDNRSAGLHRVD